MIMLKWIDGFEVTVKNWSSNKEEEVKKEEKEAENEQEEEEKVEEWKYLSYLKISLCISIISFKTESWFNCNLVPSTFELLVFKFDDKLSLSSKTWAFISSARAST